MAKLVDSHVTVRPFIPKLLPGLIKIETTVGDPEARGVIGKAIATLRQVGEIPADSDGSDLPPLHVADEKQLSHTLQGVFKKLGAELPVANVATIYSSSLAANLVNAKNFDVPEWDTLAPYIAFVGSTADPLTVVREWVVRSASEDTDEGHVEEDEEEGEDLCNCQFSLAYGAKILLNTAVLRLKRGHRYGLCGKNGTGKSTLMRAITNGFVAVATSVLFMLIHPPQSSRRLPITRRGSHFLRRARYRRQRGRNLCTAVHHQRQAYPGVQGGVH